MPSVKLTLSKSVETREELDAFIRTSFGENPEANKGLVIEAHPETLKALNLSEDTTVHGVRFKENEDIEAPEEKGEKKDPA